MLFPTSISFFSGTRSVRVGLSLLALALYVRNTTHPAPQVCRRFARRKARALSRPFTVALNIIEGGMYHVDRSTSLPVPIVDSLLLCCCQSIVFMLVFGSGFLAARLCAIGRAARNTTKFRSILLEGHKEPELRFTCHTGSHLRHCSRTGPSVGPQQFGCIFFYFCLSPAMNYFLVDIDFSVKVGTTVCC